MANIEIGYWVMLKPEEVQKILDGDRDLIKNKKIFDDPEFFKMLEKAWQEHGYDDNYLQISYSFDGWSYFWTEGP